MNAGKDVAMTAERRELLLKLARAAGVKSAKMARPSIKPNEGHERPLSFAQQRMLFIARLDKQSDAYLVTLALQVKGDLDVESLRAALTSLLQRHEALRTTFDDRDDEPRLRISPASTVQFSLIEHDFRSHVSPSDERLELFDRARRERFDLANGPLIRGLLVRECEQVYSLLICMHHIIADGWSVSLLMKELGALYAARIEGREATLEPVQIQYSDYAHWQRGLLAAGHFQEHSEYWKKSLAGAPALCEVPTTWPRPPVRSNAGGFIACTVSPELTVRLRAVGHRQGMSLFGILLASWAALLSRLSGQQDLIVGASAINRPEDVLEGTVGLFANTIPLRLDASGAPTVGEWLKRVQSQILSVLAHQELPFDQIVEMAAPERSSSYTPLVQTFFAWHDHHERVLGIPGLDCQPLPLGSDGTAKFDLMLKLSDHGSSIEGGVEFASALFDESTIERYVAHWMCMLEHMVEDDGQLLQHVHMLSHDERDLLLRRWNDVAPVTAPARCIHELFEAQAARRPEAIAVVHGGETLSYGELNARSNRLARRLRQQGAGPDVRIGLCGERGLQMVVSILAVLKSGAAYVPLDAAYPAERLLYMLRDSGPAVLLVDSSAAAQSLASAQSEAGLGIAVLEASAAEADAAAEDMPCAEVGVCPQHLAYVIYTSGSTGEPKGVMVEHAQVVRLFESTADKFDFGANDVWTLFHSFGFDFSVWEIWGALFHGGRLVVVPLETARAPEAFYELLCSAGVTVLNQTPSAFRQLVSVQGSQAHRLRYVVFGGEALEVGSLRPWYARESNRGVQLVNMYGITETTVHVTYRALSEADAQGGGGSPIGERLADLRTYVLDEWRQPVAIGVAGELYVGGAGVARGYLNRPELTAQRFMPDPFAGGDARMYRSGDLVRWLPEGSLEYVGRNDFQVKIRGFRIELGEIEARLSESEGVSESVVVVREDEVGDKRLVAYYVGRDEAGTDAESLRLSLLAQLPEHMVPSAFVRLPALPLTANGKVDRKALPAPESDAYARRAYAPPTGDVETALAAIWSVLLKQEQVGRHDNFFELGGHSLLAVALLERMRRADLQVDVREIFNSPTLAQLAAKVRVESTRFVVPPSLIEPGCSRITPEMLPLVSLTQAEIDQIVDRVDGGAANVQDIYPLAPLQEGLLFHHLLAQDQDPFMLYSVLRLPTRQHTDRYIGAVRAVIDRNDLLRTSFAWDGLSEPVQVVWRSAPLPVEEIELDPADGEPVAQLRDRYSPENCRLDVREAPLMRIYVAHDKTSDTWLLMMMTHHLIDDYTTYTLMLGEIVAHVIGRESELPPPQPFRNFIAQVKQGPDLKAHEEFFREMLGDVTDPAYPFGMQQVHGDGAKSEYANIRVDRALSRRLRQRARALGVSAASIFHVAWAQVLARFSGRDDVVFCTVLFGRMQGGMAADRVMGVFINTLPLRIQIGEFGVADSVRRTYQALAELLRHEHAPLALAQRCSSVPSSVPLFSALLNYRYSVSLPSTQTTIDMKLAEGIEMVYARERSNYPLMLAVDEVTEGFDLTTHVDAPIDPKRVCEFMHRALEVLVDALEQTPERPLRDLDVMPPAERAALIDEWNGARQHFPNERCVHELFEAQARATPDATALLQGADRISYRELDVRADRLASHLLSLGVEPDDRVAICMQRSIEFVVALLAVLKAGGAYVPLDPSYPDQRLAYMLQDSAPVAVLTAGDVLARCREAMATDNASSAPVVDVTMPQQWESASDRDLQRSGHSVRPSNLAYVIYTSGSTGKPKGVAGEHRALVNRLHWAQTQLPSAIGEVHAQKTSISFVDSITETLSPLCFGATLLIVPQDVAADPSRLLAYLNQYGVARLTLVPSLLEALLDAEHSGEVSSGDGTQPASDSIKTLVCSGEALSAELVVRQRSRFPDTTLYNFYGSSEVAGDIAFHRCDALVEDKVPIGRPISNGRIYILDVHGRPSPIHAAGEIYVGGEALARGYLNQHELTTDRFLPDPFVADIPGARMYRTGDVGRWRKDGTIEYLGRNDSQVKIRGFRIELGEIEDALRVHPAVSDAVVLASGDGVSDKRLIAYCVASADTVSVDALRAHLGGRLPAHMMPAAFVYLPALPLTPNGKLDRRALAEPAGYVYAVSEYEQPVGRWEQTIAEVWRSLLGLERVSRNDKFLELGGHSLLAVQASTRLRKAGVEAEIADLFQNLSVRGLAELVANRVPEQHGTEAVLIRSGKGTPLFVVHDGAASLLYASTLASFVADDVPIYGLPPVPLGEPQLCTIEGMAARMVKMMRATQSEGPYRVVGWCTGGALAYEIAVQLLGEEQRVSFVGLLNTTYWHPERSPRIEIPDAIEELLYWTATAAADRAEFADAMAHIRANASSLTFSELATMIRELGLMPPALADIEPTMLGRHFERRYSVAAAGHCYVPAPLPIPVHYFSAVEHDPEHPLGQWDEVLSDVEWRLVPVQRTHQSMMQLPDVRELGAKIADEMARGEQASAARAPQRSDALHTLQTGQPGVRPLLCLPGAGANIVSFQRLVGALDRRMPIFGLQPRGVDGQQLPHATVAAAASSYLHEIRHLTHDGPIHLLGHSFGGWIAFEMACRLRKQGREIASLTVLDTRVPDKGDAIVECSDLDALMQLVDIFGDLAGRSLALSRTTLESLGESARRTRLHECLVEVGLVPRSSTPDVLIGPVRTFTRCVRTTYTPSQIYAGKINLVLVDNPALDWKENRARHLEIFAGWKRHANEVELWHGPGSHMTVLNVPDVQVLAEHLKRACFGAAPALTVA